MNKFCKQIDLGIDPITGKRVRKRIYGTSKTDLERNIKESLYQFGKHGLPSNITFKQYLDKWFKAYCSNLQASTRDQYMYCLNHTRSLYNFKMSNITRIDVQNIVSSLNDHPATARRLTTLLANMWNSAVIDGVVGKNIVVKIKQPKQPKTSRRALTKEELNAIRKTKFTEQEQLLVNILRQFGLRPGEALALGPKDFNKKNKTLTINKAVAFNKEEPYLKSTKTGVTRVLPVPDEFFSLLPKEKCLYFFNYEGQLLTKKRKDTLFRHIVEKVNETMGGNKNLKIADFTMYFFRHTKATEFFYMQSKGVTIKMAAAYLGHSEAMLLKTYAHLDVAQENTDLLREMVI